VGVAVESDFSELSEVALFLEGFEEDEEEVLEP
jgi:hypothetical protein